MTNCKRRKIIEIVKNYPKEIVQNFLSTQVSFKFKFSLYFNNFNNLIIFHIFFLNFILYFFIFILHTLFHAMYISTLHFSIEIYGNHNFVEFLRNYSQLYNCAFQSNCSIRAQKVVKETGNLLTELS